jgi:integrase
VIAGHKHGEHLVNLQKPWRAIRKRAGLEDVRIHDLRHTFASVAAASGASLPIIGKLLGHAQSATTERYAHLAADPVRLVGEQTRQRLAGAGKRPALIVEN